MRIDWLVIHMPRVLLRRRSSSLFLFLDRSAWSQAPAITLPFAINFNEGIVLTQIMSNTALPANCSFLMTEIGVFSLHTTIDLRQR